MDQATIAELAEEAFRALERGDHVRALQIADQLAAILPDDALVRVIRSQALLDAGNAAEALEEARQAVQRAPENDRAQQLLGRAAWQSHDFALAQQSFERAVEISGRKPALLAEYAWFMACAGAPKFAEAAARRAMRADAACPTAWAALGRAQHRLNRLVDAQNSLGRALELDPNNLSAQAAMVMLLRARGDEAKATALARVMEDNPAAAQFLASAEHEAKAVRLCQRLLEHKMVRPYDSAWSPLPFIVGMTVFFVALCFLIMGDRLAAALSLLPLILLCLWRLIRK